MRRKNYENAEFDMAALIDLVFLLLFFFMCSATLSKIDQIPVELPESENAKIPENLKDRAIVSICDDGSYIISGTTVTADELRKQLHTSKLEFPQLSLYIRADRNCKFEYIQKLIKICAEEGCNNVKFATFNQK